MSNISGLILKIVPVVTALINFVTDLLALDMEGCIAFWSSFDPFGLVCDVCFTAMLPRIMT